MAKASTGNNRILAYGLPNSTPQAEHSVTRLGVSLDSHPLGSNCRFEDYDLIVMFAGSFEEHTTDSGLRPRFKYQRELDARDREFWTCFRKGRTFVFLLSDLLFDDNIPGTIDLFRRVMKKVPAYWHNIPADGSLHCKIDDFASYIEKYGIAYSQARFTDYRFGKYSVSYISGGEDNATAFIATDQVFVLPARVPNSYEDALDMAALATCNVLQYLERVSTRLPEWSREFEFSREEGSRKARDEAQVAVKQTSEALADYETRKRALCCQSDPLVAVVGDLLRNIFELHIDGDDRKRMEDLRILDEQGKVVALIEVKGISGNLKSRDVGQANLHRDRQDFPSTTPSILILNTFLKATSLEEKDQPPNQEQIKYAARQNVLVMRTLDLLRFVDLVERGIATPQQFYDVVMSDNGWLRVDADAFTVIHDLAPALPDGPSGA